MAGYACLLNKNWRRICDNIPADFYSSVNELIEAITSKSQRDSVLIRNIYLNEIWLSEIPPPRDSHINTQELVERYVVNNDREGFITSFNKMLDQTHHQLDANLWWNSIHNLFTATNFLFGDNIVETLSIDFVKRLHDTIGQNLDINGGKFRTFDVRPFGSSVVYLQHGKIEERLPILIDFINKRLESVCTHSESNKRILLALCLGGFFFSEFLLIHPFQDGNGRTARFLLSVILKSYITVPISLYHRGDRALYLNMLEDRGSGGFKLPWSVISYVIKCALDTVNLAYFDSFNDSSVSKRTVQCSVS